MQRPLLLVLFLTLLFTACTDPDQQGCTNPSACNYDASAMKDDGTCTFCTNFQSVWADGKWGAWDGNAAQGAIVLNVCHGSYEVFSQQPPAPPAPDTTATDTIPVDTIPVDTLTQFPRDTVLRLLADETGKHLSHFALLNSQNATAYTEGSLEFGIRRIDSAVAGVIHVFIDGNIIDATPCGELRRSDFVDISTQSLSDSLFTQVRIPIRDFAKISTADVSIMCGFTFEGPASTGFEFSQIRWSTKGAD